MIARMRTLWHHEGITRSVICMAMVAAVCCVLPFSPLQGPVADGVALVTLLVGSWYAGPISAAGIPLIIFLAARLAGQMPMTLWPTAHEIVTFTILTVLTMATGLAGQYRRRLQDTLERHQSRQREQSRALDAARIVFCDLNDHITNWSAGAEQLFGWMAVEAEGRIIYDLLATQFPQPIEEIRAVMLREGQWQGEVRQKHKDGSELQVMTHWILTRTDTDAPAGIAKIFNDVTALRAAEAAAREADRRKDIFLATLAHELRNPLSPLRSGLELLALQPDRSPVERETHGVMQRQMQQLVRLIDDLLDLGRINAGKIQLQREPIQVASVLRNVCRDLRTQLDAAELTCRLNFPDEPLVVDADDVRITQAVMNVMNNAMKFTPPQGKITLAAYQDGLDVVIAVRDTGIGIRPEALPALFEMFNQEPDLLAREHGGLGIGLSIVRSIVEMHGGTVAARSAGMGQGSEFTIRLPLAFSPVKEKRAMPPEMTTNGFAKSRRVLVVDDNQDAAGMLARLLKLSGCEMQVAHDGETALQAAQQFRPHAFVLDLGMPGMSGIDLAQQIRALPEMRDSVLIAVTGWGNEEDRRRTADAGFDHHLVKPVDFDTLRDVILGTDINSQSSQCESSLT